ncbi:Uncharacterised protein [Mycobacteroides abscessus subsp. abscessus]|nr:Uncharacterised protein [Mycobacteroides abscessus subsp. abscessus]
MSDKGLAIVTMSTMSGIQVCWSKNVSALRHTPVSTSSTPMRKPPRCLALATICSNSAGIATHDMP